MVTGGVEKMKWIIAGTRSYKIRFFIYRKLDLYSQILGAPDEVITGGAEGIDELGNSWAKENGIATSVFPADWDRYGKSAGPRRNAQMAKHAGKDGLLLAFWDGHSRGTKSMIDIAGKKGLKVIVEDMR